MRTPGPRKEVGNAETSQVHPPHVTENDQGADVQRSMQSPTEVFPDGRAIIGGTDDIAVARTVYARYIGT